MLNKNTFSPMIETTRKIDLKLLPIRTQVLEDNLANLTQIIQMPNNHMEDNHMDNHHNKEVHLSDKVMAPTFS